MPKQKIKTRKYEGYILPEKLNRILQSDAHSRDIKIVLALILMHCLWVEKSYIDRRQLVNA